MLTIFKFLFILIGLGLMSFAFQAWISMGINSLREKPEYTVEDEKWVKRYLYIGCFILSIGLSA